MPSRDPKSCFHPVCAGPGRSAGKALIRGQKIKLEFDQEGRFLAPAVSDRTWPERTGVASLPSSPAPRCEIPHAKAKNAAPQPRENFMDAGSRLPLCPRAPYLDRSFADAKI